MRASAICFRSRSLDTRRPDGTLDRMTICGVVCDKEGFGATLLLTDGSVEEHDLELPPALLGDRAQALAWLTEEAKRFFKSNDVTEVRLWAAAAGKYSASRERYEHEACVQIGAHHSGAAVRILDSKKVVAAYRPERGKVTIEQLRADPGVQARSNKDRRDQYLMVKASLD
jgi:hypothetical protein